MVTSLWERALAGFFPLHISLARKRSLANRFSQSILVVFLLMDYKWRDASTAGFGAKSGPRGLFLTGFFWSARKLVMKRSQGNAGGGKEGRLNETKHLMVV